MKELLTENPPELISSGGFFYFSSFLFCFSMKNPPIKGRSIKISPTTWMAVLEIWVTPSTWALKGIKIRVFKSISEEEKYWDSCWSQLIFSENMVY